MPLVHILYFIQKKPWSGFLKGNLCLSTRYMQVITLRYYTMWMCSPCLKAQLNKRSFTYGGHGWTHEGYKGVCNILLGMLCEVISDVMWGYKCKTCCIIWGYGCKTCLCVTWENMDGANGQTGGKNRSSTFVLPASISFGLLILSWFQSVMCSYLIF